MELERKDQKKNDVTLWFQERLMELERKDQENNT